MPGQPVPVDAQPADREHRIATIYPRGFSPSGGVTTDDLYLNHPAALRLAEFFQAKGIVALKQEDQREQWYGDWLAYQAEHRIYASMLSPARFSNLGFEFDLLRYARFVEVFAYWSPAHGYSAQVSFLGLFSVLMGASDTLKQEAVTILERGGLLAFGISEQARGSDLLAGDFRITEMGPGRFVANGSKYYIGNSNAASMLSVLAKRTDADADGRADAPVALIALRPEASAGYRNVRKIHTLGIRAAYVGEFEVTDHELPETDLIAEGRGAWDAVLGTVTLGKLFLGFGSIGICEHALEEAADHLGARMLYGKPVTAMPHIRSAMAQAYARITAMKLYAYRALDYVQAAGRKDRRYLLYCAVQKAKVSTEGVTTMTLLSACVGAKGFEADTYFEMALRDIRLIPSLESSEHINLGLAAQFCPRYFDRFDEDLAEPPSLIAGDAATGENAYLTEARVGSVRAVGFAPYLDAYRPLRHVFNVRLFARQVRRFRRFVLADRETHADRDDLQYALAVGECLATIAYAQLIAENALRLDVPPPLISAIFHGLVSDLNTAALTLAALPQVEASHRSRLRRLVTVPRTDQADWDFVSMRMEV